MQMGAVALLQQPNGLNMERESPEEAKPVCLPQGMSEITKDDKIIANPKKKTANTRRSRKSGFILVNEVPWVAIRFTFQALVSTMFLRL